MMDPRTAPRTRPKTSTIVIALMAGLVVLLFLFPASGVDSDPPVCRSMLFFVVPCEAWVAWAAGAATAGVAGLALWMIDRRR